jgi:hypothetical protein
VNSFRSLPLLPSSDAPFIGEDDFSAGSRNRKTVHLWPESGHRLVPRLAPVGQRRAIASGKSTRHVNGCGGTTPPAAYGPAAASRSSRLRSLFHVENRSY